MKRRFPAINGIIKEDEVITYGYLQKREPVSRKKRDGTILQVENPPFIFNIDCDQETVKIVRQLCPEKLASDLMEILVEEYPVPVRWNKKSIKINSMKGI